MTRDAAAAVGVAALLAVVPARAAPDVWQTHGPPAARVTALALEPGGDRVLIGAPDEGLWRSVDGGETFILVAGFAGMTPTAIAFDPVVDGRVYAGVASGSGSVLFVSTDDGEHFSAMASFLDGISTIAVDPSVADRLYVSADFAGLRRSDDGGATFSMVDTLLQFDPVTSALAIDPLNSDRFYADVDVGIAVSHDGGATIAMSPTSPPDVTAIAIDPTQPNVVYATSESFAEGGVYVSTDFGATWVQTGPELTGARLTSLVLSPTDPSTLFAGSLPWTTQTATGLGGVYRSSDGGASWSPMQGGLYERAVRRLAIGNPGLLLGGEHGGVYRSVDDGATWTHAGDGLTGSFVAATALTGGGALLAAVRGAGVFVSGDAAVTWSRSSAGLPQRDVTALALDPSSSGVVLAGTDGEGVYRSSDGGQTWTASTTGAETESVRTLAIDPSDPMVVFMGTDQVVLQPEAPHLFKSVDGGHTWAALAPRIFDTRVTALLFAESKLFVATSGSGLWVTGDGGQTFEPANEGAGTYGQFLLSLAHQPLSGRLFQGQHGGGLGVSDDLGESWTVYDQGLPGYWLSAVRGHPVDPNRLYIGTQLDGMATSADGGMSFSAYNQGLGEYSVTSLQTVADGSLWFAATAGHGVFAVEPASEGGRGGSGGGADGGAGGAGGSMGGEGGALGGGLAGGASGDGAGGDPPGAATPDPAGGCGCRVGARSDAPWSALALVLGAVVALFRRVDLAERLAPPRSG